jgi:hypothetical protein
MRVWQIWIRDNKNVFGDIALEIMEIEYVSKQVGIVQMPACLANRHLSLSNTVPTETTDSPSSDPQRLLVSSGNIEIENQTKTLSFHLLSISSSSHILTHSLTHPNRDGPDS